MHSLHQHLSTGNGTDLLTAALGYHHRGWSIIPVRSKVSAIRWKPYQHARASAAQLRAWCSLPGITGIAVVLGEVTGGLICRDYDDDDAYHRWASTHPDLAGTLPTVKTSRGHHVYSRGETRTVKLADGELRGEGGYVLLPPSLHPSGCRYSWTVPLPNGPLPTVDPGLTGVSHTQDTQRLKSPMIRMTCVSKFHDDLKIADIIEKTLPSEYGQRNAKLFQLARHLKGLIPDATPDTLRKIVKQWHSQALTSISTKPFSHSWVEFTNAWQGVRVPVGITLATIIAKAKAMPTPAKVAELYDDPAMHLLTALCATLQQHHGDGSFPLSCRVAGDAIGRSKATAARMLKTLAFDGVIELVKVAGSKGSKDAAEYRFITTNQDVF